MTQKTLRIGLVGYKFMGKAHSNAFGQVARFFEPAATPVLQAVCGRDKGAVSDFAAKWGWQSYETDWRKLIERDDIDVIDISAPSDVHRDIAVAAAEAGKHVFCEKPLAFNLGQGKEMLGAARQAGVVHMVNFNYRRVPALSLAQKMIAAGDLGVIRHFRATYLQDWLVDPNFPMNWRLRKEVAGSGAHGDLNAHLVDLAHFLVGPISEVVGMGETFIRERPSEGSSAGLSASGGEGREQVTVDDTMLFLARFCGGAVGTFEATRLATGRKNYNRVEINGSQGSLAFCFEDMNVLEYYSLKDGDDRQGFRKILVTEGCHPYVSAWWPPGHILGYEHTFVHGAFDLIQAIEGGPPATPDFRDGAQCLAVLDAVEDSIGWRTWAEVKEVE